MTKACLIIVFNHRFDRNIPVLEALYGPRFSHIYFLVPFYDGTKPNVIPVYESSNFFQSYFAQGFRNFFHEDFTHYIFIGDDCILNPAINETNVLEQTGLQQGADFAPEIFMLHDFDSNGWWHAQKGIDFFNNRKGAEISREIPAREEAVARFKKHGYEVKPLTKKNIFGTGKIPFLRKWQSPIYKEFFFRVKWKEFRKRGKIELPYPVAGSYSDILIITKESIKDFCRYCGAFAAAGLFVEIAVPTALLLVSKKIMQEKDLRLKGKAVWSVAEVAAIEQQYNLSLRALAQHFPDEQLYYHPIKLSKWKNDL